jgi:hypothetical protein
MASTARRENYTQTAKRTFSEMIAELQAGQRSVAQPKPVSYLQSVPVSTPAQSAPMELPEAVNLKSIDLQRRQNLLVSHVNRTMPAGCHVLPWSIFPKELFQTALGRFLMIAFDFHACGPENTLLLPASTSGANYLSLPRHPLVTAEAQVADASHRIGQLRDTVMADHQRTREAMRHGDMSAMYKSIERQSVYRQMLSDSACDIAETAFGQNIWASHETHFRKLIQSL